MKKIIVVIMIVVGLVSTVNAIEIVSEEAFAIEQKVEEIFSPYGLHVVGSYIRVQERGGVVFLRFCIYKDAAEYAFFSNRDYRGDGPNFILVKKGDEFEKVHKGFKKKFFGKKEVFMEIEDLYEEIPVFGMMFYEIEIKMLSRKNIYMETFASPMKDCPQAFLYDLEDLIKKEEQEIIFQLEAEIKEILDRRK